jgi:hypothetical protein
MADALPMLKQDVMPGTLETLFYVTGLACTASKKLPFLL